MFVNGSANYLYRYHSAYRRFAPIAVLSKREYQPTSAYPSDHSCVQATSAAELEIPLILCLKSSSMTHAPSSRALHGLILPPPDYPKVQILCNRTFTSEDNESVINIRRSEWFETKGKSPALGGSIEGWYGDVIGEMIARAV
jgi:hypothetical protein